MMRAARHIAVMAMVLAVPLAWLSDSGAAQSRSQRSTTSNVPNAVQGFSKNRNQPIQIEANSLEVQDKNKLATFRGQVRVKQGDTELRCSTLVVYYEEGGAPAAKGPASTALGSEAQRIRRLEAKGNVIVQQKEQTATGDTGTFDMRKNTITLNGNVVVSHGRNVLRGDRLVVDMATAVSHLESTRGRVQGLFQPSDRDGSSTSRGNGSIMPQFR
jgi:lipopolysaccharide export system protein LptA